MKQDKLEKYVREHREAFDVLEPGESLWQGIAKPTPKTISMNWKTIAIRVAAVVVIFIASYFTHDWIEGGNHLSTTAQEKSLEKMDNVRELMEAEVFYSSQINDAKGQIVTLSGNNHELIDEINFDLIELDDVYSDLKNDLKDNGDNEEVIEAMIQNYRLKLQILEDILIQLKKSNQTNDNQKQGYEI